MMNTRLHYFLSFLFSPSVFVWGILILTTLMMLALVQKYSSPIPYVDAWITAVDASAPEINWPWLWEQQNEHRYPIVKFLACVCYRTVGSMQPLCFLSVLLAAVTSVGLMLCARRLRGRTEWTDAVFPMILLHGCHFVNFLWSVQLFFVTAGCLACWCAIYLTSQPEKHRWYSALGAFFCLTLLPLYGVMGLVFAFAFAFGFLFHGIYVLRRNRRSISAWLNTIAPFVAGILALLYVTTKLRLASGTGSDLSLDVSLWVRFRTILECAATSLGYIGIQKPLPFGICVFLFSLGTFVVLFRLVVQKVVSRSEALSWFLILGAVWIFPLAIGIGRSTLGGAAPRYGILAVPLLVSHILFWVRFSGNAPSDGLRQQLARFIQIGCFTFFCAFLFYHASTAVELGKQRQEKTEAFLSDIEAGLPYEVVAGRNWGYWSWSEGSLAENLLKMKAHGVKPFISLSETRLVPKMEIPLPAQTEWEGTGPVFIPFELPNKEKCHVKAIRLTFHLEVPEIWSDTQLYWDSGEPFNPGKAQNGIKSYMGAYEQTWTVWIDSEISRFVLIPQMKGAFKIKLLKAEELGTSE